jgi:hypothetical protein
VLVGGIRKTSITFHTKIEHFAAVDYRSSRRNAAKNVN